ncbi:RUS family member 1 isoform X2 [Heliangelus exortis]|uniref:RUS family member 1 isoform X2 n=1 Tax=Heliangelus exortis TaxID=472823 RepID=UPI003A8C9A40
MVVAGPPSPPALLREFWGPHEAARYRGGPGGALRRHETPGTPPHFWLRRAAERALLPQGFPESVSGDYGEYQSWDGVQALCSTLLGALSTRALLEAVGVGDSTATATGATLTWVLRDGVGMVTRITFTWLQGTRLDCEAKQWRLAADVINDVAFVLELLAPDWPRARPALLTCAAAARCVVAWRAGATRAALAVHQARRDNMADVAAKDSSQETLVNGLGLLLALLLLPLLEPRGWAMWGVASLLVAGHVGANIRAIGALRLEILNRPRLRLALGGALRGAGPTGGAGTTPLRVPTPGDVNPREPLLPGSRSRLKLHLGAPLSLLVTTEAEFQKALECGTRDYIIILRPERAPGSVPWEVLAESSRVWRTLGPAFLRGLEAAGWETTRHLLAPEEWQLEWAEPIAINPAPSSRKKTK